MLIMYILDLINIGGDIFRNLYKDKIRYIAKNRIQKQNIKYKIFIYLRHLS